MKANAAFWLLAVIGILLLAANALQLKLNHDNGAQTDRIGQLVDDAGVADLATCERGNESRVVTVQNLHKDIAVFRSDIAFGKAILDLPGIEQVGTVASRTHDFIEAHHLAIRGKRQTIHNYIEAQAPVAVHPGSVVADCQKVVKTS